MEYENELKNLDDLFLRIINEKNQNKRLLLINDYFILVSYLDTAKIIDYKDYINETDSIYNLYYSKTNYL